MPGADEHNNDFKIVQMLSSIETSNKFILENVKELKEQVSQIGQDSQKLAVAVGGQQKDIGSLMLTVQNNVEKIRDLELKFAAHEQEAAPIAEKFKSLEAAERASDKKMLGKVPVQAGWAAVMIAAFEVIKLLISYIPKAADVAQHVAK